MKCLLLFIVLLAIPFHATDAIGQNPRPLNAELRRALTVLNISEEEYRKNIAYDDSLAEDEDAAFEDDNGTADAEMEDDYSPYWIEQGIKYRDRCDSVQVLYENFPSDFTDVTKEVDLVFGDIPPTYSAASFLTDYDIFALPCDDILADEGRYIIPTRCNSTAFPGGDDALYAFLKKNFKIPKGCEERGKMVFKVTIGSDGSVANVRMLRSLSPELDSEGMRVVRSLPRFIPASRNGIPYSSNIMIPINVR